AATREVLQAISQSRDDEQPVFEVILENAARLCNAPHAGLLLVNDDESLLQLVASNSATSRFIEQLKENPHSLTKEDSLAARAIRTRQIGHYPDIADDPEGSVSPQHKAAVETEGMRTALLVPLLLNDSAIGTVFLYKRRVEPFHDDEIALVETFAAQAVIAIENVRQFRELQTRLEREAASREILQVISRSRADEKPVFDVILESASRLCSAPLAFLSMTDEARQTVTIPAHRGARSSFADILENFSEPLEGSPLVATIPIREGEVILSDDLGADERYPTDSHRRHQLTVVEGARSLLAVPLISEEKSIGAIILYRREVQPFSEDDVALVQSFAAQAVIAIENVKQFRALEAKTQEVQALNEGLEARVEEQVGEIERMGRLKRFLSPQVADAVVSSGSDKLLSSHRALIATLFCDIRGFTAFCETAEPEETIEVLQTYHEEMGKLMSAHGAGVDHRMGDGIMVIFNDPLPCDDPAGDALKLGMAMRDRMAELGSQWRKLGHRLGFGVGISLGYATVGMVGSEGRYEYTANGTAVNLAARLCDRAADGEILLSPRAYTAVEELVEAESSGEFELKGIKAPVEIYRVLGLKA
ncbi:MAG: GAF domain-containing protein, partial [Pseudomonadota bacterium]